MDLPLISGGVQPLLTETAWRLEDLKTGIRFCLLEMSKNVIEIGKQLMKAKEIVRHGAWQIWLEDNLSLSPRTARRFMQIADRFGKTDDVDRFAYSQLTEMLSLPEEEEKKFIAEQKAEGHSISEMSVKKLRLEIQKYKAKLAAVNGIVDDADSAVESDCVSKSDTRVNIDSVEESKDGKQAPQNTLDQLFDTMKSLKKKGTLKNLVEQRAEEDMKELEDEVKRLSSLYGDIKSYMSEWKRNKAKTSDSSVHKASAGENIETVDAKKAKETLLATTVVKTPAVVDDKDGGDNENSLEKLCDKEHADESDRQAILSALYQITLNDDENFTRSKYLEWLMNDRGFEVVHDISTDDLHYILVMLVDRFKILST